MHNVILELCKTPDTKEDTYSSRPPVLFSH